MSFKRPLLHLSISVIAASVALSPTVSWAQSIVSAHSGTVHYFDGAVSVDGEALHAKTGRFSELKEQQVLKTTQGRAEVLLTPGVFLRVAENSEIRMLDNRLASTRVELLSGSVAVESDDPQMSTKDSPVTLIYKDYDIRMVKYGLLEVSTEPAVVKVYKGEAAVTTADSRATVKEGHQLPFSAALLTEKFNDKVGDDLYLWSRDRSQSLSAASMSSARSLNSGLAGSGFSSGGVGYGGLNGWNSNWFYNSSLGMYTFVPGGGMFLNAFGYGFFSPYTIYDYYTPTNYWYGGAAGMIGRPINGVTTATTATAPLSTLRGGASAHTGGIPALGAPMRGGGVVAAGNGGGRNADFGGAGIASAANGNFGGIPAGAPSAGASAGSFGGSRGGGFSGGGGGGVAAAPAASHGGGGGGVATGAGARGR
jgi:hypothetical protein